jgi:hypothetical protein
MEQVNMSKIASLQAGLDRVAGRSAANAQPAAPAPSRAEEVAQTASRKGKVHIGAYLPDGFRSSVRLVQAQTGEDTQTLLARALNDLFRSHNVPVIDPE